MASELLVPILSALAGLYGLIIFNIKKAVKNETCIKRIEDKVDNIADIEYIKEELTDMKDAVRMLKDG